MDYDNYTLLDAIKDIAQLGTTKGTFEITLDNGIELRVKISYEKIKKIKEGKK